MSRARWPVQSQSDVRQLVREQRGLSTLEYAVLFVVLVVGSLALWQALGKRMNEHMTIAVDRFGESLDAARPRGAVGSRSGGVRARSRGPARSMPPARLLKGRNYVPTTTVDADGGTKDLWRTCQDGNQTACKNLEAVNERHLTSALAHIKIVAPDLVQDPADIEWDDSEAFWREASGATSMLGGTVTLARGYGDERELVNTLAHELGHVQEGVGGRVQTAWEDFGEDQWGPRHQAIADRADRISSSYPDPQTD